MKKRLSAGVSVVESNTGKLLTCVSDLGDKGVVLEDASGSVFVARREDIVSTLIYQASSGEDVSK